MEQTISDYTTEMAVLAVEAGKLKGLLENFIQNNDDPMKYHGVIERLEQLSEQLDSVASKCATLSKKL